MDDRVRFATPEGGQRSKRLRSAVRAVRKRRPVSHKREGDPELRRLVEEPYTDVDETNRRLRELLEAFEKRNDRRAVFLSIYSRMTRTVAQRTRRGEFADPGWVSEYLVAFANLYRDAVYDYESGLLDSLADPWQLAFEAAEQGDSMILQDAVLGINAHINYDLPLALEEVGIRPNLETKYEDHCEVTDVIRDIIDDAQDSLAARDADGLETLDESFGRLDERVSVFTIGECRDSAWRTAKALHSRFGVRRKWARWINDTTSTGAAYLILSPQASERVHETLVDIEDSYGESE